MGNYGLISVLSLSLSFVISLSVQSVSGESCSSMTVAAVGDDLTMLREKAFAAFRDKCRREIGKPNETTGK